MSLLNVVNVSHHFGGREILKNANFRLLKGEHVGIVGANGEGKSTFINIILGKELPSEGKIEWAKHLDIGYLDQYSTLTKGKTIREFLKEAFNHMFEMEEQIVKNYEEMANCSDERMQELLDDIGEMQSILESSGLLKQLFVPLKKISPKYVTLIVMFVGILSTFIGDYSYVLLLPIAGILYKYIGRNSSLGILTMFIAITIGYGTGFIYNYQAYELGNITELSASAIINNYNYELLSNIFVLIASTIILSIFLIIVVYFTSGYFKYYAI